MSMTTEAFTTALAERLSLLVHDQRTVVVEPQSSLGPKGRGTASVFVTFVNLPTSRVRERRGGGAESENNRMLFCVRGFNDRPYEGEPAASVTIEQLVRNLDSTKMRKKTADPDKVATYLANYINDVAAKFAPRFTHEDR